MQAKHQPEAPPPAPPPVSIVGAIDILVRQKRKVREIGGLVYVDGKLLTAPQLLDEAYGPPRGKYR